jgi:hypothetical protein
MKKNEVVIVGQEEVVEVTVETKEKKKPLFL